LAQEGQVYAIFLPYGGTTELNLAGVQGPFEVKWYDSRAGGELQDGTVRTIEGGAARSIGQAPRDASNDWAVLVRRVNR